MEVLVEIGRKNENPLFPPSFTEVGSRSTEEIKEDIKLAKELGAKVLGFTGGEPTIRKDIFELVSYAKSLEIPVIRIQSNGIKFEDMEFAISLSKFVDSFRIFLFGREEIHDYLVQVKGAYKQVVKGIENLKKLGKTVEIDTVLTKENYRLLPQMVRFFMEEYGISRYVFIFPSMIGNFYLNLEKLAIKLTEAAPYVMEALDIIREYKLDKGVVISMPPCLLKGYEEFIAYDNKFKAEVVGHKFRKNLDLKMKTEKRHSLKCKECIFSRVCGGIRYEYASIFGFDEIKPVKGKSKVNDISEFFMRRISKK
ncbi:MAG: radical SAM protein [Candidatus Aenigmarchaeota archaeon]|nr:radical SAM protein [Candidatus Aenigmarchaeota archaeon]